MDQEERGHQVIRSLEMWIWQSMEKISWMEYTANEEMLTKMGRTIYDNCNKGMTGNIDQSVVVYIAFNSAHNGGRWLVQLSPTKSVETVIAEEHTTTKQQSKYGLKAKINSYMSHCKIKQHIQQICCT